MNTNPIEKASQKLKTSLTFRFIAIVILVLLLLIPTSMIKNMIRERQSYAHEAIREVSQKWGHSQKIAGPVLNIPYLDHPGSEKSPTRKIIHLLPDYLNIDGRLKPHKRHRGIYDVIVYEATLQITGNFSLSGLSEAGIPPEDLLWDQAFLSTGITDLRGIQERILLNWDQESYYCSPGIADQGLLRQGVSTKVKLDTLKSNYSFQMKINLNGSQKIEFQPLGKETEVKISSDWPAPKFDGAFLPDTHNITDEGFTAQWNILHLNRNYPQQWTGNEFNITGTAFGAELITPVDHYQKSMRTIKYAILVISLTFLIFFFTELRSKRKVHPLQYILVGLALVLFYSLLVALSDHIRFDISFLISSLSIVLLVSVFSGLVFRKRSAGIRVFLLLTLIYAFIFTLLQLESYALLAGNIGLFIILMVIMWISRKINNENPPEPSPNNSNQ